MTTKIVTGYTGSAHVTAQDVQHLLNGVFDQYNGAIFDLGHNFDATLDSANKVTVSTGDAIIKGGVHVRVTEPESVTIDSGAQGMNRNDIIALRYAKDTSNVESCKLVVIKGTPSSSAAADPSWNSGSVFDGTSPVDLPLWRVKLTGVNVAAPERMTKGFIPRITDYTNGNATYDGSYSSSDANFILRAERLLDWVWLKLDNQNEWGYGPSYVDGGYRTVATLPAGFRPKHEIKGPLLALASENPHMDGGYIVKTNGEVGLYGTDDARYCAFNCVYPAAK